MYTSYLKESSSIRNNKVVEGRTMTFTQLDTLLKHYCRFPMSLKFGKVLSVQEASDIITFEMSQVHKGIVKERAKEDMKKFKVVRAYYEQKHPDVIEAIRTRLNG